MERTRWTDERLDERMSAIDHRLDQLTAEVAALRQEMRLGFAAVQGELVALHRQLNRIFAGFAAAAVGIAAASHF
jgi:hypothetical protein